MNMNIPTMVVVIILILSSGTIIENVSTQYYEAKAKCLEAAKVNHSLQC